MSVKHLLAALAIFVFILTLTACTLSASTPPPSTPTTDSQMGTLEAELGNIATQTAAAGGGSVVVATPSEPSSPGGTPEGGGPTQAPQPEATQAPQPEQPGQTKPNKVPEWKPTPGLPQTYSLQKFEFPFCIARRFNLNQNELLSLNGLGLNSVVPVGFTLKIPQTGNHFAGTRALQKHPTTYTVVAGDTIYKIACQFGSVDPNGIIAVNKLKSPYTLDPGQKLAIP